MSKVMVEEWNFGKIAQLSVALDDSEELLSVALSKSNEFLNKKDSYWMHFKAIALPVCIAIDTKPF